MNLLKKLGVSILTAAMLTVSAFGISSSNSYAATSCKKVIKPNITYKYDIDGDKDKDTIKVYESKGKLLLKVNSCTTTLISDIMQIIIVIMSKFMTSTTRIKALK